MIRHFTVSAFVSAQGHTLLHFHQKNQMWLPPGGHIESDEDPIQAALREVEEETGLKVALLPTIDPFPYLSPPQLPTPVTIMVEDIPAKPAEPAHQHLDLIYFTRPLDPGLPTPKPGWRWLDAETLTSDDPISPDAPIPPDAGATGVQIDTANNATGVQTTADPSAPGVPVPEDVRILGLASIARAAEEERAP